MNKYCKSAIALVSLCSIGLVTLSLAKSTIAQNQSDIVKDDIELQRLNNSLATNLNSPETVSPPAAPKPAPQPVSTRAIKIVKEFEGFKSEAYLDTDGTPVIGYGLSEIAGKPVQLGDRISRQEADLALKKQLQTIEQQLDRAVEVQIGDRQLDALASLAFNVGIDSIENSTLVKKLNTGDYTGAANEFLRWDKANVGGRLVKMPGLTRRRQAEKMLFLHLDS